MCYDCFIDNETRMKLDGTWEYFDKARDLRNERSITSDYKKHLTGYIIQEQNDQLLQLIKLSDLGHYAPLDSYFIMDENEFTINVVIPKYAI